MKKAAKSGRKSGDHMPSELGPAKAYMTFWCSQDDRLGKYKKQFADILKQAMNDADFRGRLLSTPERVLREFGVDASLASVIRIVDNSHDLIHLMIPRMQAVGGTKCSVELRDSDLVSRGSKEVCRDDFNIGDNWRGANKADLKDNGDPHNVDK